MKDRWEASIKRESKCQHGSFSCPLQNLNHSESFFQVFPLAIMWRFPKSWGYPMFIIQLVVGDYQWENPCFGVAIWVSKPPFLLLWEAPLGRSISSKVTKLFWTALGGVSRGSNCLTNSTNRAWKVGFQIIPNIFPNPFWRGPDNYQDSTGTLLEAHDL